ncbi:MAG: hypothetical protein IT389_02445 [Nitrospira sp.]|nr:hypothetical protein [Nitrospira sp.]
MKPVFALTRQLRFMDQRVRGRWNAEMPWAILTVIFLAMSASGCIMVRDGAVPTPGQRPAQSAQPAKKSIALHVAGIGPQGKEGLGDSREQAIKAYLDSDLFSSVITNGTPADLHADITVLDAGDDGFSWSAAVSAITFTMIPGYVAQDLATQTSYRDRQSKEIGTVEKREKMGFWIQFFLMFAMPFADSPAVKLSAAQYDMHRATIEDAHQKGIF